MDDVARVVLGVEHHDVAEEVMHFLDRSGRARVIATAADDRQLTEAIRQLEPDAVVAQPSLVRAASIDGVSLVALDTRETVASLRAAIDARALAFVVWPGDRDALLDATVATLRRIEAPERRAVVVAVHGSRGGAGSTFVATHLARAFARRDASCILIDADVAFGDVATALGVPLGHDQPVDRSGVRPAGGEGEGTDPVRTLIDLLPLVGELAPRHLDQVLWTHPEAFRILVAPGPGAGATVTGADVESVAAVAAAACESLVLHVPRTSDDVALALMGTADHILEVLTLDVASFRAARGLMDRLEPVGLAERVRLVVNRATRAEITPRDVARVFGTEPLAVLPLDRSVPRAQDHGRLISPRGRTARTLDRLARRLLQDVPRS